MTQSTRVTVNPGTPVIVPVSIMPVGVDVTPGAGGTMTVEGTRHPGDSDTFGAAKWFAWAKGTVNTATEDLLLSPYTFLRFTAAVSPGVAHVAC